MALDHGVLNLPLSKRGDIDSQIDKHKARAAAHAKRVQKLATDSLAVRKDLAAAALSQMIATPGLLASKAAEMGCTEAHLKTALSDYAKWDPSKIMALQMRWFA